MILKPSNLSPDNLTFDANESITVTWKNNGDMMMWYEVVVEDNSTGEVVYGTGKIQNYISKHIINGGTLPNGKEFRFHVKVYNSINQTASSDYKIFKTSSRPVVIIHNEGIVRNQELTLSGDYSQAESVPMKCFKFILYDSQGRILEETPYVYNQSIFYNFVTRLQDDTYYLVECIVISQNDTIGTSGRKQFFADYIKPQTAFNIESETFVDKPFIRLKWTTVRIIGEAEGIVNYTDNGSSINLLDGMVYFDRGFNLDASFSIRLWVKKVKSDTRLLVAKSESGRIEVRFYNNRFHAFMYANGLNQPLIHVTSSPFTATDNDLIYVCLQRIGDLLDIESEVL